MSNVKLLSGVLLGAAAGAVLGILLAPEKGSETRKKLSQKGADLTESLKSTFNDFVDRIGEKYDDVKSDADRLVEEGKDKANQLKNEYQHNPA